MISITMKNAFMMTETAVDYQHKRTFASNALVKFLHVRWTLIVMVMVIVKTNLTENWRELLANACA
jgi:hypothetical protein